MRLLEFIAKYDPFLARHIAKQGNAGSGHCYYLPITTCEDLIYLMAQTVPVKVITQMKNSVYNSTSIDSTPDVYEDQPTIAFRNVSDKWPVELFPTFLEGDVREHTSLFF